MSTDPTSNADHDDPSNDLETDGGTTSPEPPESTKEADRANGEGDPDA